MKKAILIADSGGSKTDWRLIESDGSITQFETASYHPQNFNEQWISAQKDFWNSFHKENLSVYFFGAGCLNAQNQKIVQEAFAFWGFKNSVVQSDLIAAAFACLNEGDGYIGILGTGSVIAKINEKQVIELHGGFGYLLGDEGSGYYFGKLLLNKFLNNEFSEKVTDLILSEIGSREVILQEAYGENGKRYIASLASQLKDFSLPEINAIHRENIHTFCHKYLPNTALAKRISFVGSYAFHQEAILSEILLNLGWKMDKCFEKPIDNLVEYLLRTTV